METVVQQSVEDNQKATRKEAYATSKIQKKARGQNKEGERGKEEDLPWCVNRPASSETEIGPDGIKMPAFGSTPELGADVTSDTESDTDEEDACFAHRFPWRMIVSREFVREIKDALKLESDADFNLAMALFLAVEPGSQKPVVFTHKAIAECIGIRNDKHRNYTRHENATGERLEDFIRRILPSAIIREYRFTEGLAREVSGLQEAFGDELLALRDAEFAKRTHRLKDPVYLTLRATPFTKQNRYRTRKQDRVDPRTVEAKTELAQRLIEYVNGLKPECFAIDVHNLDKAHDLVDGWEHEGSKRTAKFQLAAISADSYPQYEPSSRGATVRIFTRKASFATIKSELRRILAPDWIELDLASAQAAIVAADWGLPKLYALLQQGRSIWESLHQHMRLGALGVSLDGAKPLLKKGLYSAIFGGGHERIVKKMQAEYEQQECRPVETIPAESVSLFFTHELIVELLVGRTRMMDQVRKNGGAYDVFGRGISLRKNGWKPHRVLAQLAQAREMKLLEPAIDLAIAESERARLEREAGKDEYPRFQIMLWQHDGFSLHVRDKSRAASIVRRFQEDVESGLGDYPTRLEVKYKPGWLTL